MPARVDRRNLVGRTSATTKRVVVQPMTRTNDLRRLVALAAAALALGLGLGACSDDDENGGSANGSAETTEPAESAGSTKTAAEGGDAVAIEDFAFKPGDLEVKAGTTVTFTNKDDFAHTATAKDKSFDTGNLDKDAAFEHTFEEAGTFDYVCAIHNSMTGTITVS